jgi:hypothetical protein
MPSDLHLCFSIRPYFFVEILNYRPTDVAALSEMADNEFELFVIMETKVVGEVIIFFILMNLLRCSSCFPNIQLMQPANCKMGSGPQKSAKATKEKYGIVI